MAAVFEILVIITVFGGFVYGEQSLFYILADKGESCREGCLTRQANCDMTDLTKLAEEDIMNAFKVCNCGLL